MSIKYIFKIIVCMIRGHDWYLIKIRPNYTVMRCSRCLLEITQYAKRRTKQ